MLRDHEFIYRARSLNQGLEKRANLEGGTKTSNSEITAAVNNKKNTYLDFPAVFILKISEEFFFVTLGDCCSPSVFVQTAPSRRRSSASSFSHFTTQYTPLSSLQPPDMTHIPVSHIYYFHAQQQSAIRKKKSLYIIQAAASAMTIIL